MTTKYKTKCIACGAVVNPGSGHLEKVSGKWQITCEPCFDRRDHSGYEDRCCGDMAYEDTCAERCGL